VAPSEGVEAILTAAGIAGTIAWPIAISRFKIAPDQQVALIDLPGRTPEVLIAQDYPGIQILVRGSKEGDGYTTAREKAKAIFNILQAIPIPCAQYPELGSCVARHDVAYVGYDEFDRPIMSLNFDLIVTPTVLGNRIY
jgi:hypothetical protein